MMANMNQQFQNARIVKEYWQAVEDGNTSKALSIKMNNPHITNWDNPCKK